MSTIDQRTAYLANPFFSKHLYGDFAPFYATIAVCTVLGAFLIALNIICCCCSRHKAYWQDRNTGNLWLVSIWSRTPHKQPPIDLTELKDASEFHQIRAVFQDVEAPPVHQKQPLHPHRQHRPARPERSARVHSPQQRDEYVELQKRESDI